MGTWMDQVTRGWLIYELTDSALQLGLVRGIQAIPFLLLSPIAGSTADRYSRKFQVVAAQFANGFLYAVTALLIFAGLIRLDEKLEVQPDAASSWQVSADGTTYTFTIRDGLVFADGAQVTAGDFVYSINRALSPDTA